MTDNDRPEFLKLMTGLSVVYSKEITGELLEIYYRTLQDFDLVDVSNAINEHVKNPGAGKFFPKPADLIEKIVGAKRAWRQVLNAISRHGQYHKGVTFKEPAIGFAINEMGGWRELCMHKNLNSLASEFFYLYEKYSLMPGPSIVFSGLCGNSDPILIEGPKPPKIQKLSLKMS